MATRVSRGSSGIKWAVVSGSDWVVVGIDVHKRNYHVAIWCNGQLVATFVTPAAVEPVAAALERVRAGLKSVVYEAGPTGFGLARALLRRGFPAGVVAPSKTPRVPGRQSKTDRKDCRTLAVYEAKGLLRHIAIPTDQEEQDRQVVRFREQRVVKLRRVKQQIKSFLLMHGLAEPAGLAHWSLASIQALRTLAVDEALRFCLDGYLEELGEVHQQLKRVDRYLWGLSKQDRHAGAVALLRSHPGVGRIVSIAFRMEVFDPARFTRVPQLAHYLGLDPRIYQSGQTCREGSISKEGRRQLRATLIEAAWVWIRRDPAARQTYQRLVQNTGSGRKAVVGMARRLGIHLWKMLCTGECYRPAA